MISDHHTSGAVAVKPSNLAFGNLDLGFEPMQDSPGLLMMSQDSNLQLQLPTTPSMLDDYSMNDMLNFDAVLDGTADEIHDAIADFLPPKQGDVPALGMRALTPEPQPGFYGPSAGTSTQTLATHPRSLEAQPLASAGGAGLTVARPKAEPSRIAGRDSTNTRTRRVRVNKAPAKATRTAKTRNMPTKAPTKRKRSKMPEEEQKRRNCESAKRSRLKKMQMLKEAQEQAARLADENQAWRKKFDDLRNWAVKLSLHVAGNHKECGDCTLMRSQQQLEQLLSSPVSSPNAQLR